MVVWNDWDESLSVPARALLRVGAEEEGRCQGRVGGMISVWKLCSWTCYKKGS